MGRACSQTYPPAPQTAQETSQRLMHLCRARSLRHLPLSRCQELGGQRLPLSSSRMQGKAARQIQRQIRRQSHGWAVMRARCPELFPQQMKRWRNLLSRPACSKRRTLRQAQTSRWCSSPQHRPQALEQPQLQPSRRQCSPCHWTSQLLQKLLPQQHLTSARHQLQRQECLRTAIWQCQCRILQRDQSEQVQRVSAWYLP